MVVLTVAFITDLPRQKSTVAPEKMKNGERNCQNEALPKTVRGPGRQKSNQEETTTTMEASVKNVQEPFLLLFCHLPRAAVYPAAGAFVLL